MSELYSNLKLFGFPKHLEAIAAGEVVAPVQIRIKPLNACNHHCWFCAYRAEGLDLGQEMSLKDRIPADKMREITADIIEMGVRAVTFSGGGEPLLYPQFVETATELGKAGVRIAALTNGTYLRDKVAETFVQYGTWVRVSMDYWDAASCNKSRGGKPDEFDRILANMRNFKATKTKCVLGVSFVVSKDNAPHLFDFCAELKEVGVNHVKLSPVIVGNSGKENNEYHAPIQQLVHEQIARAAEKLNAPGFTIVNHYHQLDETFDKPYTTCPFLQFLTVIGADCKVYTCQDKAYSASGCLGSIKDRRFKEFWFSEENRKRIYSLNPSHECNHHCVTNSKNMLIHQFLKLDKEHALFV
jgi:Fe-coproporphyrin III synthase